jgi:hypothetical protein
MQPKIPEDILGNPSITNLIWQTCIKVACKEVLKIKDLLHRQDAKPIDLNKIKPNDVWKMVV